MSERAPWPRVPGPRARWVGPEGLPVTRSLPSFCDGSGGVVRSPPPPREAPSPSQTWGPPPPGEEKVGRPLRQGRVRSLCGRGGRAQGIECRTQRGRAGGRAAAGCGAREGRAGGGGARAAGQSPKASACLRAFSRRSAMLEFLLLLLAAAATTAAADADSASDAMGKPKGGGGNIR